jgi:hypothetical protein
MLGVEVGVVVGNSMSSTVAIKVGVGVGVLDGGVSSIGVVGGVFVVWGAGKLQDDTPKINAIMNTHKRFLIHSSFSEEYRNR